MSAGWSRRTDWWTVCARASGRRHYNSYRRQMAAVRRHKVALYLIKFEGIPLCDIAEVLGVHPSTISRDRAAILASLHEIRWPAR